MDFVCCGAEIALSRPQMPRSTPLLLWQWALSGMPECNVQTSKSLFVF
jgi:hypothetical protein